MVAVSLLFFLMLSWSVGNLVHTMPYIYGGGEVEEEFDLGEAETGGGLVVVDFPIFKMFLYGVIGTTVVLSALAIFFAVVQKDKSLAVKAGAAAVGASIFIIILLGAGMIGDPGIGGQDVNETAAEAGSGGGGSGMFTGIAGSSLGIIILVGLVMGIFSLFAYQGAKSYLNKNVTIKKDEDIQEQFSSTIDQTVEDLYSGKDVRSTIIRAYQKMCRTLEDSGVSQDDDMTPREFKNQVMGRLDVSKEAISDMTTVFEEARYSRHQMGDSDRKRALDNLERLRGEIGDE